MHEETMSGTLTHTEKNLYFRIFLVLDSNNSVEHLMNLSIGQGRTYDYDEMLWRCYVLLSN
jgi:hypothetical protein